LHKTVPTDVFQGKKLPLLEENPGKESLNLTEGGHGDKSRVANHVSVVEKGKRFVGDRKTWRVLTSAAPRGDQGAYGEQSNTANKKVIGWQPRPPNVQARKVPEEKMQQEQEGTESWGAISSPERVGEMAGGGNRNAKPHRHVSLTGSLPAYPNSIWAGPYFSKKRE